MSAAPEFCLKPQTEPPPKASIFPLSQNPTVQPQVWTFIKRHYQSKSSSVVSPRALTCSSTSSAPPYAPAQSVCKSYIRLEQMLGEQALSYPCIRKSSSNSSMSSEMPGFYLFENPCTLDHNTPRKYHSYKVFLSICAISSKELCSSF